MPPCRRRSHRRPKGAWCDVGCQLLLDRRTHEGWAVRGVGPLADDPAMRAGPDHRRQAVPKAPTIDQLPTSKTSARPGEKPVLKWSGAWPAAVQGAEAAARAGVKSRLRHPI